MWTPAFVGHRLLATLFSDANHVFNQRTMKMALPWLCDPKLVKSQVLHRL